MVRLVAVDYKVVNSALDNLLISGSEIVGKRKIFWNSNYGVEVLQ